jgi:hypothetical protein
MFFPWRFTVDKINEFYNRYVDRVGDWYNQYADRAKTWYGALPFFEQMVVLFVLFIVFLGLFAYVILRRSTK